MPCTLRFAAVEIEARRPEVVTLGRVRLPELPSVRALDALFAQFCDPTTAISSFEMPDGGCELRFYFCSAPDEQELRALLATHIGVQAARALQLDCLQAQDWVAASLGSLKSVAAGRFVLHGRHDRGRAASNLIGIEIAAALAFGTGHHGTTRGCLLAFDRLGKLVRARRVLDLGTGTGVLAIAAAKALRCPVLATDIDKSAVAVARTNTALNGVKCWVEVTLAAGLKSPALRRHARFDLIFANILLEPLVRLSRPLSRVLAPGGRAILSGLLPSQANAALSAYRRCGLRLERRLQLEGWVTLVLVRAARVRRPPGLASSASTAAHWEGFQGVAHALGHAGAPRRSGPLTLARGGSPMQIEIGKHPVTGAPSQRLALDQR